PRCPRPTAARATASPSPPVGCRRAAAPCGSSTSPPPQRSPDPAGRPTHLIRRQPDSSRGIRLSAYEVLVLLARGGAAAGAEGGEGILEEGLTVGVRATLLHVRGVRLVRLVARGLRRGLTVLAGGQPAARAVPGLGDDDLRLRGEARARLVSLGAPVGHPD